MTELQQIHIAVCNKYAREFEKITDTVFDYWIGVIQGRSGMFSDYVFTIDEIMIVVDFISRWNKRYGSNKEVANAIFRWYNYGLDATELEKKTINLWSWLSGYDPQKPAKYETTPF